MRRTWQEPGVPATETTLNEDFLVTEITYPKGNSVTYKYHPPMDDHIRRNLSLAINKMSAKSLQIQLGLQTLFFELLEE